MPLYEIETSVTPFKARPGSEYRVRWGGIHPGDMASGEYVGYFEGIVQSGDKDYALFFIATPDRHERHTAIDNIRSLHELVEMPEPDPAIQELIARHTLVAGNYLDGGDEDEDARALPGRSGLPGCGVITSVWPEGGETWLIEWQDGSGDMHEERLAAVVEAIEAGSAQVVVRPLCPCPCHSEGAIDAGECFCIPECVRGEARTLDFMSREALVAWLAQNDHNGCHTDEDCLEEGNPVHTLASARACYRAQMDLEAPE